MPLQVIIHTSHIFKVKNNMVSTVLALFICAHTDTATKIDYSKQSNSQAGDNRSTHLAKSLN